MFKQQDRAENAPSALMDLADDLVTIGKCDQAKANAKAALESTCVADEPRQRRGVSTQLATISSQAQSLLEEARTAVSEEHGHQFDCSADCAAGS